MLAQRIRILFPITDLPRDGAQRQLLELVRGLDKTRFSPIVVTLSPGGPLEREFRSVPGVRTISLRHRPKYPLISLLSMLSIFCKIKPQVVQPFLTPATFFGLLPAIVFGTPVRIVTERNGPENRNQGVGYRLYRRIEDFLTRFADWAVPNSQAGKEYLVQRGIKPSRIKVIHNGMNPARLAPMEPEMEVRQELRISPSARLVGMMARMYPQKNHAAFLEAAAMISRSMPETRFALLGDGPLRSDLERLSRELGIGPMVTFLGERDDVASYLSTFDIVAHTSNTEGCSNSLLEAMALGKAVVATDVGGNREIVRHGETGILVPAGDVAGLARSIMSLLQNPELMRSMGAKARAEVLVQFSLGNMVRQYQFLYETTVLAKCGGQKCLDPIQGVNRDDLQT